MVEGKSQVPVVLSDLCVCHGKHRPIYPHTTTQEQINKRYFMGILKELILVLSSLHDTLLWFECKMFSLAHDGSQLEALF